MNSLELLENCETRRFLLNREDRGSVDKTISGQSCVNWDSLPSKSRFGKRRLGRKKYRELGLGDHNFCRNPNDKRLVQNLNYKYIFLLINWHNN